MRIAKTTSVVILTLILSQLVTACGGGSKADQEQQIAVVVALTQTAIAIDKPPAPPVTAAPTALTGDYLPISEQECTDLNNLLSQQTGLAGTMTNPAAFDDYVNKTSGFGCEIALITNRADPNYNQFGSVVTSALKANGWVEDNSYTFPGIGGLVSAYRKGNQLCLTADYVEPSDKNLCNANENFLDCLRRLPPEQVLYGYDLNCAQPAQ